jgi:Ca2+-binding EF-hand superfamily protein
MIELKDISFMDDNGAISKSSFEQLIFFNERYQGKFDNMNTFIDMLFKAFDRNSSGSLSFKEFLMSKRLIDSNDLKDLLRFIFCFLDLSQDNTIEKNEILIFLQTIQKTSAANEELMSNEEYAQKMVNDLDSNNDGQIDEEEFIEGILKNEFYSNLIRSIKPSF